MAIFSWLLRLVATVDNLTARGIESSVKKMILLFKSLRFRARIATLLWIMKPEAGQGSLAMIVFALVALVSAVVIPLLFV